MNCSSLEGILSLVFHIPSWRQSLQKLLVLVEKIMNLLNPTFGLRDKVLNDYISAIDEQKLNVRMQFKISSKQLRITLPVPKKVDM